MRNVAVGIIGEGDADQAAALLQKHLEASCKKVIRRAELVRESFATPHISDIDRVVSLTASTALAGRFGCGSVGDGPDTLSSNG